MDLEKLKNLRISPEAKRRSNLSLWLIFLLVISVSAGAAYLAMQKGEERRIVGVSKDPPAPAAPATNAVPAVAPAAPAAEGAVLTVSGYIVNRERIELSPRFLGQVNWIGVRKGDLVTNNQVLVVLDDAEQRARVLEVEGRLSNAKVAVEKAKLDYDRIKRLNAQKIETQQTEDDARLRFEAAQASLKEVEGSLELARTYLAWTIIRSPIDGVILEKLVHAGELVTPQSFGGTRGPSTAFLAIADPKDLQVEIDINEADLAKVSLKQPCRVSPEAYPDKFYQGVVAEIAPEANRQKGTLQVKVQILNPDRFLTPELSAKVEFLKK